MISRNLNQFLKRWKSSKSRLPLILRGARQVGKTTLVNDFGKTYDNYLYFNLEKNEDLKLFANVNNISSLINLLFLSRNTSVQSNKTTLIFIDEVQEMPNILVQLRYFHEEYPHIHVIASGSLLDFAINKIEKVPVGRVEYAELHPLNFREFLSALGLTQIIEQLDNKCPFPNELALLVYKLFHEYAMVGGMPKIVSSYLEDKDLYRLKELFNGIIESFKSDVSKYAKNQNEALIIRQIIEQSPYFIDQRINLANFGNLEYKSKEIKAGLHKLQLARLLLLVYPTSTTQLPIMPDINKRPRLHFLDIGLVNFQLGLLQDYIEIKDLNNLYRGSLVQQIVSQEIKSQSYLSGYQNSFWVREEKGTSSEVDILLQYKNFLIPIEVKSGATGTLRSLHEYMDRCTHNYAVRIYGGELKIDVLKTRNGKEYKLLNLPYFLSGWLTQHLDWFVKE